MSDVTLINTQTQHTLPPGDTLHWQWNNLTPDQSVWTANAVPLITADVVNDVNFQQNSSIEVVSQWRTVRTQAVTIDGGPDQSNFTESGITHQFHCLLKNVGTLPSTFVVFLTMVS